MAKNRVGKSTTATCPHTMVHFIPYGKVCTLFCRYLYTFPTGGLGLGNKTRVRERVWVRLKYRFPQVGAVGTRHWTPDRSPNFSQ